MVVHPQPSTSFSEDMTSKRNTYVLSSIGGVYASEDAVLSEINPALCRAARGFLNWTQDHLSRMSCISKDSISAFESGRYSFSSEELQALQGALEAAGIEFIADGSKGIGVRRRASNFH